MIKFDIVHMYLADNKNINLNGIEFKENKKTNNNEEPYKSLISYIGESAISINSESKIKSKYKIKQDEELYMITFMCSNVKEMYNKLKQNGFNVSKPKYATRRNILFFPCKTKFQYIYVKPFKDKNFTICFREINTSTDLLNYQKAMIPNSASHDITGIKEIKLHLDITNEDLVSLSKIFDNSYLDGDEFSSEIYTDQTLTITKDINESSEILLEVRGKVFKGKEININGNEEKRNITFNK